MNDNQNGMVQQGRTTSRVLAPPGGQSSFSLGVAPPPKKVAPKVAADTEKPTVVEATKKDTPDTATTAPPQEAEVLPTKSLLSSQVGPTSNPISNNAFASSASMNGAQVMTGRPSSRVLAPPGGHTSWTLG